MDTYLSRLLKNWAAEHNPPENGRADLLRRAAAQQVQANLAKERWPVRMEIWKERTDYYRLQPTLPPNGWGLQTIAPSPLLTFDITLLRRPLA